MDHYAPVHHLDRGPEALKSGRLEDVMPLVDEHPEKCAVFIGIFPNKEVSPISKRNFTGKKLSELSCSKLSKGLILK